jgi:hypothetical protein
MWSRTLPYDSSMFNSLPPIEAADGEMRSKNRLRTALSVFGPVFAKHKMCDSWGISLLHRHWAIDEGELPIQDSAETSVRREFVTAPRRASFPKQFSPAILCVDGRGESSLSPLEFSTDQRVCEAFHALTFNQAFVRDFCETALATGLSTTFGLIATKEVSSPELELVEFNQSARISVLKEVPSVETKGKTLIQTCWRFKADAASMDCEASCFARCTVSDDGSHSGDHAPAHAPS